MLVWVYFDYNVGAATPEMLTDTPVYDPPLAFGMKPESMSVPNLHNPKLDASKNAARTARNPVAVATPKVDYKKRTMEEISEESYTNMVSRALEQMRLRGDTVKWTGGVEHVK